MKILHVVTLVSPDGAFGGPLRVALNQVAELRRRGHDVDLAAGWRGPGAVPSAVDGIPVRLFPAHQLVPGAGFSGLVSPRLAAWLATALPHYDVVHVHAGRDLISAVAMTLAGWRRRPYVTQTHGMVGVDGRLVTRLVDALVMRRLLRRASTRFVLTGEENLALAHVLGAEVPCERLPNGVPAAQVQDRAAARPEVLFCARLHARKRPVAFVQLAVELVRRGTPASFSLVGPDEGELAAVQDAIAAEQVASAVHYEGALDYAEVLDRMRRAAVYVLPSVDEPFPMTLLEALSLGLPCVCTDSCGVAELLRTSGAALVTDGSVTAMADAVQTILSSAEVRERLRTNALEVVARSFSMTAVGARLERAYAG